MGQCFSNKEIHKREFADDLQNATIKTPYFIPKFTKGKVVKVYDGDTITIVSNYQGRLWKWSVRLNGIDTPELKTKNKDEKEIAYIARDTLSDKILNKIVDVKIIKYDKYGRLLCDIYHNNIHINKWLVDKKLAIEYSGGTKFYIDWKSRMNSV